MTQRRYAAPSYEIAARKLGDEMMIMSGRDSTLFTLNKTATIIWEAADGCTTLDEIVERRICPEFDVELAEALRDANTLVAGLAEHGILLLSDQPFKSPSPGQESK